MAYFEQQVYIDPLTREMFSLMSDEQKKALADKMYERLIKGIDMADYTEIVENIIKQSNLADTIKSRLTRAIEYHNYENEITQAFDNIKLPEVISKEIDTKKIADKITGRIVREIDGMDIKMWTRLDNA